MNNPLIFDCWTKYGIFPRKDPLERWTLAHLLEDLDHFGIAGALVRHAQSEYYDPMFCNRRLIQDIASYRQRLYPCWSVLPHQTGDFPAPDIFFKEADAAGVRAFCITPKLHRIPIAPEIWRPLAAVLNRRHALILAPFPELDNDFNAARQLADIFADCPIILTAADWRNWRIVCTLMELHPNIHLELHRLQVNRAAEWLTEKFGAERILFGSGLPQASGGAARGFVDWSLLPDETLAKFAGGNLRRLLGEGPAKAPTIPHKADIVIRAARRGLPCPVLAIDAHSHVLHDGLNGAGRQYVMPHGDWAGMRQLMQRMGVRAAALMSWNGTVSMDVESGNALIAELLKRHPEEIIGLSSCNPTIQDRAAIQKLCAWMHLELGCRGMKPYPFAAVSYADSRYAPWWKFCNEHRLYGLLHVAAETGGFPSVAELAERYPEATFLIAHSGENWATARAVADVAKKHSNVMAEITHTSVTNGILEWLCQKLGADRVLYGSDMPMRDPRPQLGWCIYARLSVEEKRKILGINFLRILQRGKLPGHVLPHKLQQANPL